MIAYSVRAVRLAGCRRSQNKKILAQINTDFLPIFALKSVFIPKIRVPSFFFRQTARKQKRPILT